MSHRPESERQFEKAKKLMPGGVSSPVRAYGAVGGTPPFIASAHGPTITDVDGNTYIDYVGSWGPAILGHAHPKVIAALHEAIECGTSFGAPTELETRLANMIIAAIPSIEMIRFVNSGTEATMSALRLARGVTNRTKIVKFEGCYHGHADALLVKAGSGAATFGHPTSAGVPPEVAKETIVCCYNDLEQMTSMMEKMGEQIAAIIVEPVAGNMGCVPPAPGFLEGLRHACDQSGALLIFDEVMTGFRVAFGGAQERFNVQPDLTCLGKIIGGGLPVGAYGGRRDLMDEVAPLGPVYQAGTLSGNPLAMMAGIKTLECLSVPGVYEKLETMTTMLVDGIDRLLCKHGLPHRLNRCASMWTLFFSDRPVVDFASAAATDHKRFRRFFHAMLDAGIALPPSPFEAAFLSLAHSDKELQQTIAAVDTWSHHERI